MDLMWSGETCWGSHLAPSTMARTLQRHRPPSQILDAHITVFFHCKARPLHMLPTPASRSPSGSQFQCHSEPVTLSLICCPSHPHISLQHLPQTAIIICFSSVAQSCLTLCNPIDCSMPGLPVHHQLPELTQTHVHRVGDAIHPLLSPSPRAPNPSQHQGLFK